MDTTRPVDDSLPVLAAMAYRLTDPALVHAGWSALDLRPDEDERIRRLLVAEPHRIDPITAGDALEYSRTVAENDVDCLAHLAERVVAIEGGRPVLRVGETPAILARLVDTDALAAWHTAPRLPRTLEEGALRFLAWPPVLRPERDVVDGVLGRAMAENHSHLGGALPSAVYWTFALSGAVPPHLVLPPGADDERHSAAWRDGLGRAAALVEELAGRMRASGVLDGPSRVAEALLGLAPLDDDPLLAPHLSWAEWPVGPSTVDGSAVLSALVGERRLVAEVLREYRQHGKVVRLPGLFEYLRIKNAFHHVLLHGPGPRGLGRFGASFARRSFYFLPAHRMGPNRRHITGLLERRRMAQVIECYLHDACGEIPRERAVHAAPLDLELRVSMPTGVASRNTLVGWLRGIRDALRSWPDFPLRVGLVVHFIRSGGDPNGDQALWTARGLVSLLEGEPLLRPLLVGLDVAGAEIPAPPRCFARLYQEVRRGVDEARLDPGHPPIRLGFTYHAGEDFRDLATGLRHVDEAVHLLQMRPRDRIGHGLALAWPPERFYAARPQSYPLLGEHLLDLAWGWCLLRNADGERRTLASWAADLFRAIRAANRLPKVDLEELGEAMTPYGPVDPDSDKPTPTESELVLGTLGLSEDQARKLVAVNTGDPRWLEFVGTLQAIVRERLLRKGTVLEVNPTSNFLIGGFARFQDLPYLELNRYGLDRAPKTADPALPLCLNTDDAGLFHTSLRTEYQRMGAALVAQGHAIRPATAWLDEARQVGLDATFIPPWAPRGRDLVAHIDRLLPPGLGD